jgi:hypothetical protein
VKVLLTRADIDVLKQNTFGVSSISEALKLGREDIAGVFPCDFTRIYTQLYMAVAV